MSELAGYTLLSFVFLSILIWIARPRRDTAKTANTSSQHNLEPVVPRHYRFFPQIHQALSAGDRQYLLRGRASTCCQAIFARRKRAIARRFLVGLCEDFSELERLARMVATLSPVISRGQETERILINLKFHMLYGLVWLRLSGGRMPLDEIGHLTDLVAHLALRMDRAISEINALSAEPLSRGLSA